MTPDLARALDGLRDHLDRVGFHQIYKFVTAVNRYAVTPALVTRGTAAEVERFFDTVLAGTPDLALIQCLMTGRAARLGALSDPDRRLADALVAAELLRPGSDGEVVGGDHQLISAFGIDLLIDRRIHFGGGLHEVYIGPDSYWMLYYLDAARIRRGQRAVDLCTGSGIAALYLSLFCDHVVATDIGEAPLAAVAMNRRLNRRDEAVEIRRQDLRETLDGRERFDLLTCNPPFVAFPPGYRGTLYAQGPDADGLGYLREIVARLPEALTPGGTATLVADLCGDEHGPHLLQELDGLAARGLRIDAYIDQVLPAAAQVGAMASFLRRAAGPTGSTEQVEADVRAFQRHTLRADTYSLTTLRVRTADPAPGLRVMHRGGLTRGGERGRTGAGDRWPALLLTA